MKSGFGILALTLFSSLAQAAIVCEGPTTLGQNQTLRVTLLKNSASVEIKDASGKILSNREYPAVSSVYDGHKTTLVTAPGLAVKYESVYGCVRDAVLITDANSNEGAVGNIQAVNVAFCDDGSNAICR
jgi:hypothetical protein